MVGWVDFGDDEVMLISEEGRSDREAQIGWMDKESDFVVGKVSQTDSNFILIKVGVAESGTSRVDISRTFN